ncbi:MAG: hypothetical protein VCD66_16880 [Alphaproteobacteria bacterium]
MENVEFNAGLHIALQDEDTAQRWLDGEPVFAPATEIGRPSQRFNAG